MIEDNGMFPNVKLDSSISIGYNFQPFSPNGSGSLGQIELMEINKNVPCISPERYGKKATPEEIKTIVNYLTTKR